MAVDRKRIISDLIEQARRFRFCGPSDDPDEQTAVTVGYRHLVIQFKRFVCPILPNEAAARLSSINVEANDLYSAFDANAELDALLPDIEDALERIDVAGMATALHVQIIDPALIARIEEIEHFRVDTSSLVRMCREINSSYAHGNVLATALLMRTVMNHIPPVFGFETFAQFVASTGRSLKESFTHLENGLRKVADFHTHRKMETSECYPSAAQVEPFKPQFELLMQQIVARLENEQRGR